MAVIKERAYDYDVLRVLAILLVVIGHSSYLVITTGCGGVNYVLPPDTAAFYQSLPLRALRFLSGWVYGFHMPLFFMLSGAVYALARPVSPLVLLKKKLRRLALPYYVYGILFMLPVKYVGNFYDKANWADVLLKFGGGVLEKPVTFGF